MQITQPPSTGNSELDTWLEQLVSLLRMDGGELHLGDDIAGTAVKITPAGAMTVPSTLGVTGAATLSGSATINGLITTEGGHIANTTRITDAESPYTVLATDEIILCDTDAGAIEVDLPAGVEGTHYKFYNVGSSANDLTIDPNGTETISGGAAGAAATVTDGNSLDIYYNATEGWR